MSVMLKYVPWNWLVSIVPRFLKLFPDDLQTKEIKSCNKAIKKMPWLLYDVPVRLNSWRMCFGTLQKCLQPLRFISDHLKTQQMCEKSVEKNPYQLGDFSDHFTTKEMCEKDAEDEPEALG